MFLSFWIQNKIVTPIPSTILTILCIKTILGYFREIEGCKLEDWFYRTHIRLHSRFNKKQEQKYKCSKAIRWEELPHSPFASRSCSQYLCSFQKIGTSVFSILNVVQIIVSVIRRCTCLSLCVNASNLRRFSLSRTGSK